MPDDPVADRHQGTARLLISCPDRPGIVAAREPHREAYRRGVKIIGATAHQNRTVVF